MKGTTQEKALIVAGIAAIVLFFVFATIHDRRYPAPQPQVQLQEPQAQPRQWTDDQAKLIARGSTCAFLKKTKVVTAADEVDHERTKALTVMSEIYFRFDLDEAAYRWNHELDRTARPSMSNW
jgi:hypothetical protein